MKIQNEIYDKIYFKIIEVLQLNLDYGLRNDLLNELEDKLWNEPDNELSDLNRIFLEEFRKINYYTQ